MKKIIILNLIDTYIFEAKLNNYNFQIIQNIKNIEKIQFPIPDFSSCKNVFEKSEIFISFYYKEKQIKNEKINIKVPKEKIKMFNISESKISNTLTVHKGEVNQIILLKDRRIASSSNDRSIIIYNKENYTVELKIDNLEKEVFNIMQANNGYIIATLTSGSILIFKLTSLTSYELIQKIMAHNGYVRKMLELEDNKFISCSDDKTIKIWKFNDNQLMLENTLNNKDKISSILEIKDNIIVSTPWENGAVVFWNIKESQIISESEKIDCQWCWNILKKISNEFFVVGGKKYIYLFSIVNYNLTSKIEIDSQCYSICCLSDGTILTGHENGYIKQYNFINNELKLIAQKKHHNGIIRVIYQLNNNLILSGSDDRTINIYI